MFDVSFSELLVIAVVALLVIGPEKLPKVARTVGAFMGRIQRYVAQVKEEVNREVRFEELQKLQQEIKQSVAKIVEHESFALQSSIYEPSRPAKIKTATAKLGAMKLEPKVKPIAKKRTSASNVKPQTSKSSLTKPKISVPKIATKAE